MKNYTQKIVLSILLIAIFGLVGVYAQPVIIVNPCIGANDMQDALNEANTNNVPNQTILVDITYFTSAAAGGNWGLGTLAGNSNLNGLTIDYQGAHLEATAAGLGVLDISGIDNMTIKNATLDGWNRSAGSIIINDCEGTTIQNIRFVNCPTTQPMVLDATNGDMSVTFRNCLFSGNPLNSASPSQGSNTGAIQIVGDQFNTIDATFENTHFRCNARQVDGGGAVQVSGHGSAASRAITTATFNGCTFANNESLSSGSGGGAIYATNNMTLNINDCTFFNNVVNSSNNTAGGGGAIHLYQNVALNITGSYFHDNRVTGGASSDGGAIGASASGSSNRNDVNIQNTVFSNNSCPDEGGAIFFRHVNATISGSLFLNNNAPDAGAIHIDNAGTYDFDNLTITGTTGGQGHGIENNGTLSLDNSIIVANAGNAINGTSPSGSNNILSGSVTFTDPLSGGDTNPEGNNYDVVGTQGATIGVMTESTSNTNCAAEKIGLPISLSPDLDPCDKIADIDQDSDGVPDIAETYSNDEDGDGIADYLDPDFCLNNFEGLNDWDCAVNGLPDPDADLDEDGVPNYLDEDFPGCGGIVNGVCSNFDQDGDGNANHLDLDADNDGIPDIIEAGGVDLNGDGFVDDLTDTDKDGLADAYDTDNGGFTILNPDTDGDGIANFLDLDADNDGIPDVVEVGGTDTNGDGIADNYIDFDLDGFNDVLDQDLDNSMLATNTPDDDNANDAQLTTGADTDMDGFPNSYPKGDRDEDGILTYLDLDADNDGIPDVVEAGGTDVDGDGIADNYVDNDDDGFNDIVDGDVGNDGTAENAANAQLLTGADTNANGMPNSYPTDDLDQDGHLNYLDLDSDNDGIVDVIESLGTDANGDGMVDGTDGDNDGYRDTVDGDVGNDGTSENTANSLVVTGVDGNLDGVPDDYPAANGDSFGNPNFLDIDADDDGITDNVEGQTTAGFVPPTGMDDDDDGIDNAYDNDPVRFGGSGVDANLAIGVPGLPHNFDTAADNPDYLDLDSDDDTILDSIEGHDYDYDISVTPCGAPVDTDADGLLDCYDTAAMDPDVTVVGANSGNCPLVGAGTCPGAAATELPENTVTTDDDDQPDFRDVSSPLPVELVTFELEVENCLAALYWTTASEENSELYIIERSYDGRDFESVGEVAAAGQSNELLDYSFLDRTVDESALYRLKIVDLDGSFEYSNVVGFAACPKRLEITELFPNPGTNKLQLIFSSMQSRSVDIEVWNAQGQLMKSIQAEIPAGTANFKVNVSEWAVGVYHIRANSLDGMTTSTWKWVKL